MDPMESHFSRFSSVSRAQGVAVLHPRAAHAQRAPNKTFVWSESVQRLAPLLSITHFFVFSARMGVDKTRI